MPRRRRWWVLAFGLLLGAGGVLAYVSAGAGAPPPAHFWARDGVDPPELFESPRGRAITGWTAVRFAGIAVKCSAEPSAVDRLLARVGLGAGRGRSLDASPLPFTHVDDWWEYVVLSASPQILREAVPDTDLVGDWADDNEDGGWTLHADGSAVSTPPADVVDWHGSEATPVERRWVCLGDVLVLLTREARSDWRISDKLIVEPGKHRMRHWTGATSHKVR